MPLSRNRKKKSLPASISKSSPEMAKQQSSVQRTQEIRSITSKFYQGMIPSPEMMQEYSQIDPELPTKLVKWTEDESIHRRG